MARECYATGLRVKPRNSEPVGKRSEVAMQELDPRAHLEDRMEPLGEVQPFVIGENGEQFTTLGRGLTKVQARSTEDKLLKNKD